LPPLALTHPLKILTFCGAHAAECARRGWHATHRALPEWRKRADREAGQRNGQAAFFISRLPWVPSFPLTMIASTSPATGSNATRSTFSTWRQPWNTKS